MKEKFAIVTPVRGAYFDLAEHLQNIDRLATIYTGYPRFKLRNTRVDPRLMRPLPWLQAPYQALHRTGLCPPFILRELLWRSLEWLDSYAARTLPECGLVMALSGAGLKVGTAIKRRGGIHVCERGSTHIRWQKRILDEEYRMLGYPWESVDPRIIEKEVAEYELADGITLASRFSLRTFVEEGVPPEKLHLTNYGVNLSVFRRSTERTQNFRILYAGLPIIRKGLHYLLQAFRRAKLPGAELIFVGPASPERTFLLEHYPVDGLAIKGFVTREALVEEMSKASVFVLPSVEDGFGLVLAQALACGCPVIATTNTGAEDIFTDGKEGFIIPPRDIDALTDRLTRLYRDRKLLEAMAEAGLECVRKLGGWDDYSRTIVETFDTLLEKNRSTHSHVL